MCGGCVGCVPGFWTEQAHADKPSVVIDALDDVSVQLKLGDDGGWEVNPARVKLVKSDRLVADSVQSLEQPPLLGVSERDRRIVALSSVIGARRAFPSRAAATGRLATGG